MGRGHRGRGAHHAELSRRQRRAAARPARNVGKPVKVRQPLGRNIITVAVGQLHDQDDGRFPVPVSGVRRKAHRRRRAGSNCVSSASSAPLRRHRQFRRQIGRRPAEAGQAVAAGGALRGRRDGRCAGGTRSSATCSIVAIATLITSACQRASPRHRSTRRCRTTCPRSRGRRRSVGPSRSCSWPGCSAGRPVCWCTPTCGSASPPSRRS